MLEDEESINERFLDILVRNTSLRVRMGPMKGLRTSVNLAGVRWCLTFPPLNIRNRTIKNEIFFDFLYHFRSTIDVILV